MKDEQKFREKLESELTRRRLLNNRYSLRSFAKSLELDPSYLSKLLKGKRPISAAVESHCLEKLGWMSKTSETRQAQWLKDSYIKLDVDSFMLISEWYHYAIHEIIKVKSIDWNAQSIAKHLCISQAEAQQGIDRLLRLGLIKPHKNTLVRSPRGITTTGNSNSIAAFRTLQKQLLNRAIHAMDTIDINDRDQSSMTFAISSANVPQAKKMLARFRRRFCSTMQSKYEPDAVYNLSLSFFPLTQKIQVRKK